MKTKVILISLLVLTGILEIKSSPRASDCFIPPESTRQNGIWKYYLNDRNRPLKSFESGENWPYPITIRAFIPFESFAGWFKGDKRGFSSSPNQNSRLLHRYVMNTDTNTYINYGAGSTRFLHSLLGSATAVDNKGKISNGTYNNRNGSVSMQWTSEMSGYNPLVPGSPDIDIKTNFKLEENKSKGILRIKVVQTGDAFPSTETMIGDTKGTQLIIGVSSTVGNSYTRLLGVGTKVMMNIDFTVMMDQDGVFTKIQQGNKLYSVGDWNRMMKSQPAVTSIASPKVGTIQYEMVR